jgi:hypothetical protein
MHLKNVAQERAKQKDSSPQSIHHPYSKIPRYIATGGAKDKQIDMLASPETSTNKTTINLDVSNWDFLREETEDEKAAAH